MGRFLLLRSFTFIIAFIAATAHAQHPNVERGFIADKAFQLGDVDHVNLFNGNLIVTLPIANRSIAAGLSYDLTLRYNSKVWDMKRVVVGEPPTDDWWPYPSLDSNAGLGWSLSLGELIHPNNGRNEGTLWLYIAPDGARHTFSTTRLASEPEQGDPLTATISYSRHPANLRMKVTAAGHRLVESPDGLIRQFEADLYNANKWLLTKISDQFGNRLTIGYAPTAWILTEYTATDAAPLRQHQVTFVNVTHELENYQRLVKTIEIAAFRGAATSTPPQAKYEFEYDFGDIATTCHPMPDDVHPYETVTNVPRLRQIKQPDLSSYDFTYYTANEDACSSGMMKSLQLPTKGTIAYKYADYRLASAGCGADPWNYTAGIARRTLTDPTQPVSYPSEWIYDQESHSHLAGGQFKCNGFLTTVAPPADESTTTVYGPVREGNVNGSNGGKKRTKVVNFFSTWPAGVTGTWPHTNHADEYGLPLTRIGAGHGDRFRSTQTYECGLKDGTFSECGDALRSSYVGYQSERLQGSSTVYHDDGGAFTVSESFNFDHYGHYRQTSTLAGKFGTTSTYKNTFTNYVAQTGDSSPWLLNRFKEQCVASEGSSRPTAITACSQLVNPAIVEYDFEDSGFLRRKRVRGQSTQQATDLVSEFVADGDGNVITEKFYGGDATPLATSTGDLQGLSLGTPAYQIDHTYDAGVRATSEYKNADHYFHDITVDRNSGLPWKSRDTAGLTTTFDYDSMGRVKSMINPAKATTLYSYVPATSSAAAKITVTTEFDASPTCSPVTITSQPGSVTRAAGQSTNLVVAATGSGALTYQWFTGLSGYTNSPVYGQTSATLTVAPTATTSYWVRVSNGCGAPADSVTATITVKIVNAPTGLFATATSATSVNLVWNPVPGATQYRVEYSPKITVAFTPLPLVSGTSADHGPLTAGTTYIYRVVALEGSIASSPSSNEIATTIMFEQPDLVAGFLIKARHLEQLREAVNAVQVAANKTPTVWTDMTLLGQVFKAAYLTELRAALNTARSAILLPANSYSETVQSGITVRAAHVTDIRRGVK